VIASGDSPLLEDDIRRVHVTECLIILGKDANFR
jgi:hypothetical protein